MKGRTTTAILRLLAGFGLLLSLAMPVFAQDWQRYSLGDYSFAVPSDWRVTTRRSDEVDFDSPDGRYTLWARLWFPDEPLLGYDDIVIHGELSVAGQTALFIHSEFPGERFLQYAFAPKDANGRQFLFQLIGHNTPLDEHQALFQRLAGKLVVAGVPAVPAAASPAPTDPGMTVDLLSLARSRYGNDCAPVDLAGWRHDTGQVLQNAGARLSFLALCRAGTWPVFGVDLPADPRLGGNDGLLLPFYDAMFQANGNWDFTLIDAGFGAIVDVMGRGREGLSVALSDLPH